MSSLVISRDSCVREIGHEWMLVSLDAGYLVFYCRVCGYCKKEDARFLE